LAGHGGAGDGEQGGSGEAAPQEGNGLLHRDLLSGEQGSATAQPCDHSRRARSHPDPVRITFSSRALRNRRNPLRSGTNVRRKPRCLSFRHHDTGERT
jgi:hypothetical protein